MSKRSQLLARLGRPEPHPVADPQSRSADRPRTGVCTSPAPSVPSSREPATTAGFGTRDFPAGPDAMYPPPNSVAMPGAGRRMTGSAKYSAGRGANAR